MLCQKCIEYKWQNIWLPVYTDIAGVEYCIFHAPKEHKSMGVNDFNHALLHKISDDKRKYPVCNLKGTIFPGDITFSEHDITPELPTIDLSSAVFFGKADFSSCTFVGDFYCFDAKFHSNAKFSGSCFRKNLMFSNTTFFSESDFSHCVFQGNVEMRMVDAKKGIEFDNSSFMSSFVAKWLTVERDFTFFESVFQGEARLSGVCVLGKMNFRDAEFNKNVYFEIAETIDFYEYFFSNPEKEKLPVSIGGDACFSGATFLGDAYFNSAKFLNKVEFNSTKFMSSVVFTSVKFESDVHFDESVVGDRFSIFYDELARVPVAGVIYFKRFFVKNEAKIVRVVMDNFSFFDVDLSKFQFEGCEWKADGDGNPYIFNINGDTSADDLKRFEHIYRVLKRKAIDMHDELMVSSWHYQEKDVARKLLSLKSNKNCNEKFHAKFMSLYCVCSGYGENPRRALTWICIWLLLIMILCFFSKIWETTFSDYALSGNELWCMFGNSVRLVLFMNADVGDNILGIFALLFSRVILPIQAALFAFSLRNKLRR